MNVVFGFAIASLLYFTGLSVLVNASIMAYFDRTHPKPSFSFSSRRRHTSSTRDWSSDVCSSDLRLCRSSEMLPMVPKRLLRGSTASEDRKSVVEGKSVDLGGRRVSKKKKIVESAALDERDGERTSTHHRGARQVDG